MITRSSRYRREAAYESRDPGRAEHPILGLAPHTAGELVVRREHRFIQGERLDQLAQRYYGDPLKYWLICDANDAIFPEELLVPGRVLRIPRNRL
jgi:nucleoid-associated protein YgaU